jgi:hypothetical protein
VCTEKSIAKSQVKNREAFIKSERLLNSEEKFLLLVYSDGEGRGSQTVTKG